MTLMSICMAGSSRLQPDRCPLVSFCVTLDTDVVSEKDHARVDDPSAGRDTESVPISSSGAVQKVW